MPFDLPGGGPEAYLPRGFGSDDADFGGSIEQAGNLGFADGARADDETGLALELDEHGEEARCRSLFSEGVHGVILAENGKWKIEKGSLGAKWHGVKRVSPGGAEGCMPMVQGDSL